MKSNSPNPAIVETSHGPTPIETARTESVETLAEFKYFPRLPIELRLQIYGHMMPGPQVIEVLWHPIDGYCTNSKAPVVVSINAEARQYVLKRLSKITVENVQNEAIAAVADVTLSQPKCFEAYIDFDQDIVFPNFCPNVSTMRRKFSDFLARLGDDAAAQIQHVAIDMLGLPRGLTQEDPLCKLSHLRSLSVILSDVCLAKSNPKHINTAPRYKLLRLQTRAPHAILIQRWSSSKECILSRELSNRNGRTCQESMELHTKMMKEAMKKYGMDEKVVNALQVILVDSVRNTSDADI